MRMLLLLYTAFLFAALHFALVGGSGMLGGWLLWSSMPAGGFVLVLLAMVLFLPLGYLAAYFNNPAVSAGIIVLNSLIWGFILSYKFLNWLDLRERRRLEGFAEPFHDQSQ